MRYIKYFENLSIDKEDIRNILTDLFDQYDFKWSIDFTSLPKYLNIKSNIYSNDVMSVEMLDRLDKINFARKILISINDFMKTDIGEEIQDRMMEIGWKYFGCFPGDSLLEVKLEFRKINIKPN